MAHNILRHHQVDGDFHAYTWNATAQNNTGLVSLYLEMTHLQTQNIELRSGDAKDGGSSGGAFLNALDSSTVLVHGIGAPYDQLRSCFISDKQI
jgi:hypothetical protein